MAKIENTKIVTIPNAGKDVEKLDHSFTAGRMLNVTATLENSLAAS